MKTTTNLNSFYLQYDECQTSHITLFNKTEGNRINQFNEIFFSVVVLDDDFFYFKGKMKLNENENVLRNFHPTNLPD